VWISKSVTDWFKVSKESLDILKEDLIKTRAECAYLRDENIRTAIMLDWLRMQVNTLQFERTALMEKAYGIRVPTPEIAKASTFGTGSTVLEDFSFEDMGDENARKHGLPVYEG